MGDASDLRLCRHCAFSQKPSLLPNFLPDQVRPLVVDSRRLFVLELLDAQDGQRDDHHDNPDRHCHASLHPVLERPPPVHFVPPPYLRLRVGHSTQECQMSRFHPISTTATSNKHNKADETLKDARGAQHRALRALRRACYFYCSVVANV